MTNVTSYSKCRDLCHRRENCAAWCYRDDGRCYLLKDHYSLSSIENYKGRWTLGRKTCGDCTKQVTDYTVDEIAMNQKVLTEEQEISNNYWLAPKGYTGSNNAFITIDLGCVKEINGVYLRNTHNNGQNDRGTERFELYSGPAQKGPWDVINKNVTSLERMYSNALIETEFVPFNSVLSKRYLKFAVMSFYGDGGGLSFIEENEANRVGKSHPGLCR